MSPPQLRQVRRGIEFKYPGAKLTILSELPSMEMPRQLPGWFIFNAPPKKKNAIKGFGESQKMILKSVFTLKEEES